jgi:hypothetical protein
LVGAADDLSALLRFQPVPEGKADVFKGNASASCIELESGRAD